MAGTDTGGAPQKDPSLPAWSHRWSLDPHIKLFKHGIENSKFSNIATARSVCLLFRILVKHK
jgi:hypothetical protein